MPHDTVVALDLEGTLVSNAMSQLPRHGLYRFLDLCGTHLPCVVLYTAVRRPIVAQTFHLDAPWQAAPER